MNVELRVTATRQEYAAALRRSQARVLADAGLTGMLWALSLGFWVAGGVFIGLLTQAADADALPRTTILLVAGAGLAMAILVWGGHVILARRIFSHLAAEYHARLDGSSVTLADDGVHQRWRGGQVSLAWEHVTAVAEAGDAVTIHLRSSDFILIPNRAFASAQARAEAIAGMHAHLGTHLGAPAAQDQAAIGQPVADADTPAPAAAVAPSGHATGLRGVGRNLVASLRALAFLRTTERDWSISWGQLVALIALSALMTFLVDFIRIGPAGEWRVYALPGLLFGVTILLVAAWAVASSGAREERSLDLLVAFSGMLFVVELAYVATYYLVTGLLPARYWRNWGWTIYYAPYLWLTAAGALHATRRLGLAPHLRVAAVITLLVFLALPLTQVPRDRSIWGERYDADAKRNFAEQHGAAAEDAFYLQPRLLEQALAAIGPERKGVIDLYFVGAAGYASQDVFLNEVRLVEQLFAERFDTQGRSIILANNKSTAAEHPIASGTALRRVLQRVGERMNPDEDILFLFLTSHGSKEHRFSLEFWPLQFNDLTPATLKAALDEAGIRKRVIVVSACYAGGFVEPLANEDSLIITAAASDRNSFGCSDTAELTFFGKAYFDEALRQTLSFTEAFQRALPAITARERAEGYTPSEPRMHAGENIRRALEVFVKQLEARPREAATSQPRPVAAPAEEHQ